MQDKHQSIVLDTLHSLFDYVFVYIKPAKVIILDTIVLQIITIKGLTMKKFACALVATALLPMSALADKATIYSDGLVPGDSQSKWVAGAYALSIGNIYTDAGNINTLIPMVEYRGETFFIKEAELGAKLFDSEETQYGIFSGGLMLSKDISYLADNGEYKNNAALSGLKERKDIGQTGFYAAHKSKHGLGKIKVFSGTKGDEDLSPGNRADMYYTFNYKASKWRINPSIALSWVSSDRVNYLYGVSSDEVAAGRSEYEGKSAINFTGVIRGRYALTDHWDLDSAVFYSKLGSGITDSSIVEKDTFTMLAVGTTYNF